jgi:hypothetical protein
MIIDDAAHPAVERGKYVVPYNESVDGYRHAYKWTSPRGFRSEVRYSRTANHPPDPRCPECHPQEQS